MVTFFLVNIMSDGMPSLVERSLKCRVFATQSQKWLSHYIVTKNEAFRSTEANVALFTAQS